MKIVLGSVLLLALASACAAPVPESQSAPESKHQPLMTLIEATVHLPEGAKAIDQYSRNYAYRDDGKVVAIYATPLQSMDDDIGCDVMRANFESRPCNEEEVTTMQKKHADAVAMFGKANESRWFDNFLELPIIDDGGCGQVVIVFDPSSNKIESARCNGVA